jgi:hypothetical protein
MQVVCVRGRDACDGLTVTHRATKAELDTMTFSEPNTESDVADPAAPYFHRDGNHMPPLPDGHGVEQHSLFIRTYGWDI